MLDIRGLLVLYIVECVEIEDDFQQRNNNHALDTLLAESSI
jgi:hypothetical protein